VIAAATIYCASLLAYWLIHEQDFLRFLAVMGVAASSWLVLPAIVAMKRSD